MPDPDYRYTLANERTFLSWLRTALALVAGGLAAAKALTFDSEVSRWVVALPPIVGGVALAAHALKRRGGYEAAMRDGPRCAPARTWASSSAGSAHTA